MDDSASITDDIIDINKKYSDGFQQNNTIDNILHTASYYDDPYEQIAYISEGITRHAFSNGNKRTAFDTIKMLIDDFGLTTKLSDNEIWKLIDDMAGGLDDVTEIARRIKG